MIFIFWWNIIKSARGESKVSSKGSSFDASKIKVNIKDEESCVEKFNKIIDYIKEESRKIMDSTKLEHDLPDSEDMFNVWVWFGETQEDIEESSNDNSVHKCFLEYEHNLHNATTEEDACFSLKKLSTREITHRKRQDFGQYHNTNVIWHQGIPATKQGGGTITAEISYIDYDRDTHYKRVYERKPEIKQHIEETLGRFDKMQSTIIQMAKDAVREKGL